MKSWFPIVLSFVFIMPCYAKHEKSKLMKNIRGEFVITMSSNVSATEAKEKAREEAKKQALIQAFGQQMNIIEQIESSAAGESFNSLSILKNNGEIVKFTPLVDSVYVNPNRGSEIVFYCIADVEVKEGVAPDPSFTATISGIHSTYVSEELCTFSITPTQNSYLKVFIYENSEVGYYLYPGGVHHGIYLTADRPVLLPKNSDPDIQLYTDKVRETNTIVVLLTKEEYPFNISNPSRQDIDKFIALIPNDKKYVSYHIIDILRR